MTINIENGNATTRDTSPATGINIGSQRDSGSFLIPAMGFPEAEQLLAERRRDEESETGLFDPIAVGGRPIHEPLFSGRCSYLPHNRGDGLDVQSLLSGDPRLQLGKPSWARIWNKELTKPLGAYNVALMVEGRRQFWSYGRHTNKHPQWWYRLSDGRHDCAAAWGRHDSVDISGGIALDSETRVYAARSGRGAIYSRRTSFDNDGLPSGFKTGFVLVEFSILDRDPAKDDMLKIKLIASRTAYSHSEGVPGEPWSEDLDPVWRALIDKARTSFDRFCKPHSDEVEAWRVAFLDQRAKYRQHGRAGIHSASFADGVRGLSWGEALHLVQEPWQLMVVFDVHCDSRFDSSVHRSDTNSSRVGQMLSQYDCSPERRAELDRMVTDFVAPSDKLWSYSGD